MADVDADVNEGLGDELSLAADFPAATHEQWAELVSKVLGRGGTAPDPAVAEQKLATKTLEGLTVLPLYTSADVPDVAVQPARERAVQPDPTAVPGWDIRALYTGSSGPVATHDAILTDLENGSASIWLRLGNGIEPADLPVTLEGVYLDLAPVALEAGANYRAAATALFDLAESRGVVAADFVASAGADPLGVQARTGVVADLAEVADFADELRRAYPKVSAITVDGTVFHEAGASDAQEIGYTLASGLAYLKALTAFGLSLEGAAATIEFRYAVTDDQFAGIAKLRAARRLWSRLTQVAGVPEGMPQTQHGVTSWAMLTRHDPWVNILRGTLACFAAGVGGADAITVLPYDAASNADNILSRRIARNTSTLMIEESNIGRVIDPAGGSFYVEHRTDELAALAWSVFQDVERAGGLGAALADGSVAASIAETSKARAGRIAKRSQAITGVTEFPNLAETVIPAPVLPAGGGLPRTRWAEPFEVLRDRSDAALAASGSRPKVALVTIGSRRDFAGRLGFATGAIAPGGVEGVPVDIDDADALHAVFSGDSAASVAILCSSDGVYAERAVSAAAAVEAAGAGTVLLAGKPGDAEAGYREGGIDGFVFVGSDIAAMLADVLDKSGVQA